MHVQIAQYLRSQADIAPCIGALRGTFGALNAHLAGRNAGCSLAQVNENSAPFALENLIDAIQPLRAAEHVCNHVFAMESDNGAFKPRGMRLVGSDSAIALLAPIGQLLHAIGATAAARGEGEADIGPLLAAGVPGAGLDVDGTRYFWFHHTAADTPDKLDPREVAECVATFAVWSYVVADLPRRPPHAPPAAAAGR